MANTQATFTSLKALAKNIDGHIGPKMDILEIDQKVGPIIRSLDGGFPAKVDFIGLSLALAHAIDETGWMKSNTAEKANGLVRLLLLGIAADKKWPGNGTANNPMVQDPIYKFHTEVAYSIHQKLVEVSSSSRPVSGSGGSSGRHSRESRESRHKARDQSNPSSAPGSTSTASIPASDTQSMTLDDACDLTHLAPTASSDGLLQAKPSLQRASTAAK